MMHLVTGARLRELSDQIRALELENVRLEAAREHLRAELEAERKRSAQWERRASQFIDQVAIGSGTISSPAMTEPAAPPRDEVKGIFAALGHREMSARPATPHDAAAGVLGVDERAAQAAISDILQRSTSPGQE